MKDPSFQIYGVWIMETGYLSFHMGLLGRLHHLITWDGSFDSGPGSVYFGMSRISLWAKFVIGPVPQIPSQGGRLGLSSGLAL